MYDLYNPNEIKGICDECGCDVTDKNLGVREANWIFCKTCCTRLYGNGETLRPDPTPSIIKAYLDRFVIGQDSAKKVLAVAGHTHYLRTIKGINAPKANILLCGHTGSGKTYLVERLAEVLDLPLHMDDCSSLTSEGYVGRSVKNVIELAWNKFKDKKLLERSIIFFDEFDKKRITGEGSNIRSSAVQMELLKLLEGTKYTLEVAGMGGQAVSTEIDTSNMTFVFAGAFADLMKETVANGSIGFGQSIEKKKSKITRPNTEDFIEYGIMSEILGRLSCKAFVDELTEDQLVEILTKSERNAIQELKDYFALLGHDLEFEDGAIRQIAKKAIENKTGARGLKGIVEEILVEVRFDLPDWKEMKKVVVTKDYFKTGKVKIKNNK